VSHRLLIVEDDRTLLQGLADAFQLEGYDVTTAADGLAAEELLFGRHFACVILDIMLPGRGGLELLRALREQQISVPVLLLTARGDENDKVLGLELGADDYVTKPFSLRELMARVHALVRRGGRSWSEIQQKQGPEIFRLGDVEVDLGAFEIRRDGQVIAITPTEASMLALLHRNAGKVVGRGRFLEEIWDGGETVSNRTVDTHMLNLRHKLEADSAQPVHLQTVHGAGYRLKIEET